MHKSQAQFLDETRAMFQIQSAQLERLEAQIGQMAKIILEDQERSLPTIEELIREEVDAKEFNELVAKEELTSLEPKETISLIS